MRQQSAGALILAVCVFGIEAAPTSLPTGQEHSKTLKVGAMRLPQYQTACIVDVIQNNTDPETHIVSREVEVLLMGCFLPPIPRCPGGDPKSCTPVDVQSNALVEPTEDTARSGEVPEILLPTTTASPARADGPSARVDIQARVEDLTENLALFTTASPARADEPTSRADAQAPSGELPDIPSSITTASPARADGPSARVDIQARVDNLAASLPSITTVSPARADEPTSKADSQVWSDELPQVLLLTTTASSPLPVDEATATTEAQPQADEAVTEIVTSASVASSPVRAVETASTIGADMRAE